MKQPPDFVQLDQEMPSWWYVARRNLMREFVSQALDEKNEARILDMGGAAELAFEQPSPFRVVNQHSTVAASAFQQLHGGRKPGSFRRPKRPRSPATAST